MLLETKYESFASLILFVYSASSPQTKNSFNGNPTCLTISDEKKQEALVVVDNDNLSLAIGKKGLNVKLASRLTKYKLDIKTTDQAKEMGINIVGE